MRFHVYVPALLLAAVVLGGPANTKAADRDDRAVLAARQRIRTELATAVADGHLSRLDQYRILLDAREVLPPEDLPGLERTLNRLASAQQPSGPGGQRLLIADKATGEETVAPGTLTPLTPSPAAKSPAPDGTMVSESPFVEEQSGDVSEMSMDSGMVEQGRHRGRLDLLSLRDDKTDEDRSLNLEISTGVEAFKGPLDFADFNGNFGIELGVNGGVPLLPRMGLGLQAGANVVLSDFHGFEAYDYGNNPVGSRSQDFASAGLFQRVPWRDGTLAWGFTYDWLSDHYYHDFVFTQWRVKLAWEVNRWNELGAWAALRDRGDTGSIDSQIIGTFDNLHFRPLEQYNWYWRHTWCNEVSLTGRLGFAQFPGAVITGVEGKVPISPRLALTSSFTYVMPSGGGVAEATLPGAAEFWNVSMGLEFVPGGFRRCSPSRFAPLLPVADNGTMMIKEVP
jgi:hypothetical protein